MVQRLVESAYFKLTTTCTIVVFAIGLSFAIGRAFQASEDFKGEIGHDLADIRASISEIDAKIVGKTVKGWHRNTMEKWVLLARSLNPDTVWPEPWDELFDPRPE